MTFTLDFWFASRLPMRITVLGFVFTELLLIITIRDSLFINMLMLVYPVEAIKIWQFAGQSVL